MASRSVRLFSVMLLASLLVAGMLLLAACGNGSKGTTSTGSNQATGSTASAAALTPKYGGTLRVAAPSFGVNIGWPAALAGGGDFVESYYETLVRQDSKGVVYPWLASSYKVADDKKSISFTIRKGIKFTDGSDLTADVVKWNLQQYAKASPTWKTIEVVEPDTVRVNFTTWDNSIPASFGDANPRLYIVSKAAYDKHGKDWMTSNPVGTGPFMVSSYQKDSNLKLVKNPNYWAKDSKGGKLPYLDGLVFTFTSDQTTTLMMAKTGEVDMVTAISPGKQLADYTSIGWKVDSVYDANQVWVPDSAHADSPWSKLEVREAAEYAVDRVTIAKNLGYGYLQGPNQVPPRATTAYQANYALARNYDPAKAKQLLAQAGYPNGFKTKLIVWQGNRDIALAEQQYLAAVGIKADLQFPDAGKWDTYVGPQGHYQNALLEAPDPRLDPSGLGCVKFATFLYGHNWSQPPELMKAYAAASTAATSDVGLVRATTDIVTKEALIIPVYEIGSGRAEQPWVIADFGERGLPTFSLEKVWINK